MVSFGKVLAKDTAPNETCLKKGTIETDANLLELSRISSLTVHQLEKKRRGDVKGIARLENAIIRSVDG